MADLIGDSLAGALIEIAILAVTGVVLLDRVRTMTGYLKARVAALEDWRDCHMSSAQPHSACVMEDRRKQDERERLERIERKIDRLEERIDALTERIHERS